MTTANVLRFGGLALWLPIKWTWKILFKIFLFVLFIMAWSALDS